MSTHCLVLVFFFGWTCEILNLLNTLSKDFLKPLHRDIWGQKNMSNINELGWKRKQHGKHDTAAHSGKQALKCLLSRWSMDCQDGYQQKFFIPFLLLQYERPLTRAAGRKPRKRLDYMACKFKIWRASITTKMVSVGWSAFANHYHHYGDPTLRYAHSQQKWLKWLPNHLPVKAGSMFATQIRGQGWSILLFIRKRSRQNCEKSKETCEELRAVSQFRVFVGRPFKGGAYEDREGWRLDKTNAGKIRRSTSCSRPCATSQTKLVF